MPELVDDTADNDTDISLPIVSYVRQFSWAYLVYNTRHDLAEKHPEKLRQLVELWWTEAGKYNVLPLDDRLQERLIVASGGAKERTSYTYYPGTVRLPPQSQPHTRSRSHRITAEVEIPADGKVEGPICALGALGAGWSLYI